MRTARWMEGGWRRGWLRRRGGRGEREKRGGTRREEGGEGSSTWPATQRPAFCHGNRDRPSREATEKGFVDECGVEQCANGKRAAREGWRRETREGWRQRRVALRNGGQLRGRPPPMHEMAERGRARGKLSLVKVNIGGGRYWLHGVVGYHVRFTCGRPPVRTRMELLFFVWVFVFWFCRCWNNPTSPLNGPQPFPEWSPTIDYPKSHRRRAQMCRALGAYAQGSAHDARIGSHCLTTRANSSDYHCNTLCNQVTEGHPGHH